MKIRYLFSAIFLLMLSSVYSADAQDFSAYRKRVLVEGRDSLPYRLLAPEHITPGVKYPLIIVLHGSGERGSDNKKQLVHGASLFLVDSIRKKYPAFVVFPQCPESSYWSDVDKKIDKAGKEVFMFTANGKPSVAMRMLMDLEKDLQHKYPVDTKRIYVGGLSMGGMGTFEIVKRMPHTFAAAFPICGGADPAVAPYLTETSWWIFHGLKDDVVNPEFSERMVEVLKKDKAKVKATFYPNANHNSWDSAFAEHDLMHWLFSNHK
jgi:predicted peptidase